MDSLRLLSRERSLGLEKPTIRFEDFRSWASTSEAPFRGLAFYRPAGAFVRIGGEPPRRRILGYASTSIVSILHPNMLARVQNHSRPGLISRRVWQQEFQSAPGAIGQTILVDSEPVTIAGVAAQEFWPLPGRMDIIVVETEAELATNSYHSTGYVLAPVIEPALRMEDPGRPYLLCPMPLDRNCG